MISFLDCNKDQIAEVPCQPVVWRMQNTGTIVNSGACSQGAQHDDSFSGPLPTCGLAYAEHWQHSGQWCMLPGCLH
eukprot:1157315-Pelagomonas_calceolata.AAC.11